MSLFDGITKAGFSTVESIMGDPAIWNPADNSEQQKAKVLYNNPDVLKTLGDVDKSEYQIYNYWFEYYEGQFPGLKASVDSGIMETVIIGSTSLDVRQVVTKFDGKNFIAYCDLHE